MKRNIYVNFLALFVVCFFVSAAHGARDWFVAIDGKSTNQGSIESPWDLLTAFNSSAIQPGDIVHIREGKYPIGNGIHVNGDVNAEPIVFQPYNFETVVLEGYGTSLGITLNISSANVTVRDLIITQTPRDRISEQNHSNPTDVVLEAGVYVRDPSTKLINCILHNTTTSAINSPGSGTNAEIYGNIVLYTGWSGANGSGGLKGRGHSIYFQNENGRKLVENNIFIKSYGYGIQFYSAGGAATEGSDLLKNIVISSGSLMGTDGTVGAYNFLVESQGDASLTNIHDNHSYHKDTGTSFSIGHIKVSDACDVRRNYSHGGSKGFWYWNYKHVTARDNILVMKNLKSTGYNYDLARIIYPDDQGDGPYQHDIDYTKYYTDGALFPYTGGGSFAAWRTTHPYADPNGSMTNVASFTEVPNKKVVIPNRYEPKRAHIVIHNHQLLSKVSVDVGQVMNSGDNFWLYDVEDLRKPVLQGIVPVDTTLQIPTDQRSCFPLIGTELYGTPAHSGDDFGAFLLIGRELKVQVQARQTRVISPYLLLLQ